MKFFTRRTVTTESWSWETRAVWPWLLARVDGAGVLDLGKKGGAQAVAIITGMPIEVTTKALIELEADGSIELRPSVIIIPNFIEAQESRKSEAQKKKDQRERHKAQKRAQDAGIIEAPVPECPAVSPDVPLQLSSAQPSSLKDPAPEAAPVAKLKAKRPKESKPPDPRHAPLVAELDAAFGPGFAFDGREARAVSDLLRLGEPAEVLTRWRRALSRDDYPRVRTPHELAANWNHFATDRPAGFAKPNRGPIDPSTQNYAPAGADFAF